MNAWRLWLAAVCLLAAGCVAERVPRPAVLPRAAEVLAHLRAREIPSSFRGLVGVEVRFSPSAGVTSILARETGLDAGSFGSRAALLWKAPDALRLDPLSPLGTPLLVIAAHGGNLGAYVPARRRFYAGRADAETMARLFGVSIKTSWMIRILQGRFPVAGAAEAETARLDWDSEVGALRLELPPGGSNPRRQVAWLDPRIYMLRRVRVGEPGTAVDVHYGPLRRVSGGRLPQWVEVTGPRGENRIRIDVPEDEKGTGGRLPDGLFELVPPPGAVVIPLLEDGAR